MQVVVEHTLRHGAYAVRIVFRVSDAYPSTPLGCHVGLLGDFHLDPILGGHGPFLSAEARQTISDEIRDSDFATAFMDWLTEALKEGFAAFGIYHKKSHIIISANYEAQSVRGLPIGKLYATPEVMDIIIHHCKQNPTKYGTCVVTEATENRNANHLAAANRTLVWIPPYVRRRDDKTVRKSGYTPVPEPGQEQTDHERDLANGDAPGGEPPF